jgi:TRAP-type transport system periplasmic protein
MNSMQEMDRELQELTEGQVRFKFYPGGVQGDENDVLRKIRIGQLHAGGFTGVGMGVVNPDSRILDLPFLFENSDEVDLITGMYHDRFNSGFQKGDFVLLGWTEVGLVRFFTTSPIRSLEDIQEVKLWVWQDDPLARTFFQEMGVAPVPLALPDVLSSLETGLINAAYASPYAGAVLQWHTRIDNVSQMPVANASGAMLISRSAFDRLSEVQQTILRDLSIKYSRQITLNSRQENQRTMELFAEQGITLDPLPSDIEMERLQVVAATVQQELAGDLFNEVLLRDILQTLKEQRQR